MRESQQDPYGLRPLWTALLDVYQAYAAVCRKHGLRHYVAFGTLLGTVRHKGFIPWDDDFDVLMPRPDYEEFVKIAGDELPEHLKFVNWKNTSDFMLLFGKIQDSRREKVNVVERQVGHQLSNGIFIDIFPIDGYPASFWGRILERFCGVLRVSYFRFLTRKERPPAKSIAGKISTLLGGGIVPLFRFRNRICMMRSSEDVVLSRRFDPDSCSAVTGNRVGSYEVVYPAGIFGVPKMMPFDSILVPVPENYDMLLRLSYGDYMKLPPKEKRIPTHEYAAYCSWRFGPTKDE